VFLHDSSPQGQTKLIIEIEMLRLQTRKLAWNGVRRIVNNTSRKLSSGNVAEEGMDLPPGSSQAYFAFMTGAFAGGVGSLVGMGDAFAALPFLTGMFRLQPHIAHGTSMAVVLVTSIGGCLAYLQRDPEMVEKFRNADWRNFPTQIGNVHLLIGAAVATSSSITVIAGAKLAQMMSAATLKKGLGVLMLVIAPTVPFREYLKNTKTLSERADIESSQPYRQLRKYW